MRFALAMAMLAISFIALQCTADSTNSSPSNASAKIDTRGMGARFAYFFGMIGCGLRRKCNVISAANLPIVKNTQDAPKHEEETSENAVSSQATASELDPTLETPKTTTEPNTSPSHTTHSAKDPQQPHEHLSPLTRINEKKLHEETTTVVDQAVTAVELTNKNKGANGDRQDGQAQAQTITTTAAESYPEAPKTPTSTNNKVKPAQKTKNTNSEDKDTIASQKLNPTTSITAPSAITQTSVTSTTVYANKKPTAPTTPLPNMSNAMPSLDNKDNSIDSSPLVAFAALATLVVMAVEPAC